MWQGSPNRFASTVPRQYLYVCYYFCTWWRHVGIHPPMNCRAFLWQKPFCVFTLSANQCLLANLFIKADLCWWQDQEHQTSIHLLGRPLPGDCVEGARRGILFYNKRFGIDSDTSLQGIWFLSWRLCSNIVIMRDIDCFILENFTTWHIEYTLCSQGILT